MTRKLLLLTFILGTSPLLWAQSSVDGVWDFSMNSPSGAVSAKVLMAAEGSTLTGEFDLGGGRKWPIENGTIDGDKISFSINRDGASMTYVMSASVDGNSIMGSAAAMGTTVDWSMTRGN